VGSSLLAPLRHGLGQVDVRPGSGRFDAPPAGRAVPAPNALGGRQRSVATLTEAGRTDKYTVGRKQVTVKVGRHNLEAKGTHETAGEALAHDLHRVGVDDSGPGHRTSRERTHNLPTRFAPLAAADEEHDLARDKTAGRVKPTCSARTVRLAVEAVESNLGRVSHDANPPAGQRATVKEGGTQVSQVRLRQVGRVGRVATRHRSPGQRWSGWSERGRAGRSG
jgi:hypothetical protein